MKYLLISIIVLFVSCKEMVNNKHDRYEIINLVSNKAVTSFNKREEFIPKPPDKYVKDTVLKQIKNPFYSTRKNITIAIYPFFTKVNSKTLIHCLKYKDLYNKLVEVKNSNKKLDLDKIKLDSVKIIPFTEKMLIKGRKDFVLLGFDILFQFSDIVFNKDSTKAVVIFSHNTSTLSGQSNLYFLEKTNNRWEIKCIEGLSIS